MPETTSEGTSWPYPHTLGLRICSDGILLHMQCSRQLFVHPVHPQSITQVRHSHRAVLQYFAAAQLRTRFLLLERGCCLYTSAPSSSYTNVRKATQYSSGLRAPVHASFDQELPRASTYAPCIDHHGVVCQCGNARPSVSVSALDTATRINVSCTSPHSQL